MTPAISTKLRFASSLCGSLDPIQAADHAASQCAAALAGQTPDFAVLHFSAHHVHASMGIVSAVRARLAPRTLIGCSTEMVLGGDIELEGAPGISLFAGILPGASLTSFTGNDLPALASGDQPADLNKFAEVCGFGPEHRGTILLADPFSTPSNQLLPALAQARSRVGLPHTPDRKPAPIIGGFASSGSRPGANVIIHNDRIYNAGLVGLSFSGNIRIDSLVSQGCKPIGVPMVITQAQGQMISQLGGRPAVEVLSEFLDALDAPNRQKLRGGLFVGRAISEYKPRFGRDDFLIRNVIGVDKANQAIAVADLVRVGQTVQFHIRDAHTASEDLGLLLDAQRLHDTPEGILLFTCNGRGTRLFQSPHHDTQAFARAFSKPTDAAQAAKGGILLPPTKTQIPTAGFFCAGEIGPVGDEVFVHGQTAAAAIFRAADHIR